jgi:hypothetical protein
VGLVLVVPGRCERDVLHSALARSLPGAVRKIINAKGDTNVIREATKVRRRVAADGHVPIFLRDLDEFPCRSALREAFPIEVPRLDILVSYRSLEAWYLADEEGINEFFSRLPRPFQCRKDADDYPDPQEEIKRLLQENGNPGGRQYDKIEFATRFSRIFSLLRAEPRSTSLRRFLNRLRHP